MKKSKTRSALGRGLDALLPSGPMESLASGFVEIDIDRIHPSSYQPRDTFDDSALDDLAQSIRKHGIIQPVVLRPWRDDFQLVAGERRWRAAQRAGLRRVPAVVKTFSDASLLEVALVENVQRQDLSALEVAKAFRMLVDEHGLTQEDLASRVGMKRSSVANYLRLLTLPDPVREALAAGRIDMGHARALSGLEDKAVQVQVCQQVIRQGLSVRQCEAACQRAKGKSGPATPVPARDPNLADAEKKLMAAVGHRVRIVRGRGGAGRIEIRFSSDAELDQLFAVLTNDMQAAGTLSS